MLIFIIVSIQLISVALAKCPVNAEEYPLVDYRAVQQITRVWLDAYSSREADTHFSCTQQENIVESEEQSDYDFFTHTTSLVNGTNEYSAKFLNQGIPELINRKSYYGTPTVFNLKPLSFNAHWFAGSKFFLIDGVLDGQGKWYAWMICNDSDEYEFHISARQDFIHREPHPEKCKLSSQE